MLERTIGRTRILHALAALPCVFLALAAAPPASAQTGEAVATADLPKGEDILDRFVEVTGGKAAYEKLKNRVITGTLNVTMKGVADAPPITGKMTIWQAAPNKMYVEQDMGERGKMMEGYDGKTAWQYHPAMGGRVKEGLEKTSSERAALFNSELFWRDRTKSVETVGIEDVDGKPAYKVVLTPKEGPIETRYFDKESGLAVKSTMTVATPMGQIPVEILQSDYREVDGVKVSHRLMQIVQAQEVSITFDKIEHNVEIPADRFDVPEQVKEMMTDDERAEAEKP